MTDQATAIPDPVGGSDGMIPAWVDGSLVPVDKLAVHRRGLRHPAVSVFVTGPQGILIQQRAAGKYHSAGLWANSCCTHPLWGEAFGDCAARRLQQELGLERLALIHRGQVEYRADVGGGMVEHELAEIFTVDLSSTPTLSPDPAEVMALRWIPLAALRAEIAATPAQFTAWLRIYLEGYGTRIFGCE